MGTRARAEPQSAAAILWRAGRMNARGRIVREMCSTFTGGAEAEPGQEVDASGGTSRPSPGVSEVGPWAEGGCAGWLLPLRVYRCGGGLALRGWSRVRAGVPIEAAFINFLPLLGVQFPGLTSLEQSHKTFF